MYSKNMNDDSFILPAWGVDHLKRNKPKYKQILDAAIEVIAENGYHQAQVSKIARKAGVADGTIYLYFKNKEDILISLFREKMGQFIEDMKVKIAEKETAAEKLLDLIENHFSMLSSSPSLAIVTQLELRQSNKDIRLKINEVLKNYLLLVDTIIEAGKDSGEFREDVDVRLARQLIFGTIDEMVTTWIMNDQKYDLKKQAISVQALLLYGCGGSLKQV